MVVPGLDPGITPTTLASCLERSMNLHRVTPYLLFLSALAFSRAEARGAAIDLELVLAVDVSGSIDARESALQREGYLAAIRSPEFAAAVRAGSLARIRLAYVEWAGEGGQQLVVPWRVIDGTEAAQAFANELAGRAVTRFRRGTSISSALQFTARLFEGGGIRRVIDISGDGPNNVGGNVRWRAMRSWRRALSSTDFPCCSARRKFFHHSTATMPIA
jgi:hypothetical protein